jgi:anti-sigma regulatory factor (Ser/Thr protein kinase)
VYYIEAELKSKTEDKTYLQVYISTACCKRRFLVEVRDNGYFDIENCEMVAKGYKLSIDEALRFFHAQKTK